jgi:hypothetical protein
MHDGRFAGTVTDEATRLASFSHDNVAAAQALIQGKKLCRVIRLTGYYGTTVRLPLRIGLSSE